ncbi:MAG: SPFH domain-containing protein [Verrucomicrobiota bacterium]|nr:SPFH domain-containing protein [Verrucomicrobiota bacterium]
MRESQMVPFVYLGEFGDTYGPGKHILSTENIPFLTKLKSWKYGFESPFKTDIYYVVTRVFTGNKWVTTNPVMMRDEDLGVVRARAFGTHDFKITNPRLFLWEVAGTDHHFQLHEFEATMRSRIVSVFSEALAESNIPLLDVATRCSELGQSLMTMINAVMSAKYGLEFTALVVENVSVPREALDAFLKG